MEQVRNEYDKFFSGQNTQQQLDIKVLLQDDEAFENVFFPPTSMSMDYNPMNINEIIDFDELYQILNEEKVNQGMYFVGPNGSLSHGGSCNMVVATHQINNNNGELMNKVNNKLTDEVQHVKKWNTRKRFKKGSKEAAQMKELHKIRNREAAARAFAEKKAYIEWLELEVQKFRKKNANLKSLLLFAESSLSLNMTRKQIRRTASGLM